MASDDHERGSPGDRSQEWSYSGKGQRSEYFHEALLTSQDTTAITSLALSYHTSPPTLITAHLSTAIRFYPLPESIGDVPILTYDRQLTKAHSAPILVSTVSPDSTLLATGSSDGIVKVWDTTGGYVTHIYRGHGGPVSALKFYFSEDKSRMELYTGSTDGRVRVFDLRDASARVTGGSGAAKPKAVLEGHVSVVRGIDISPDGKYAVTGARDKVVLVWDLEISASSKKGKGKAPRVVQTIIAQEQVETCGLIGGSRLQCFTGGDRGLVRVWDVLKGEVTMTMKGLEGVDEADDEEDEQRGVISIL